MRSNMLINMDIFFQVGQTSKSFSMVQQRWQKSLNIVGKYHRPKGNVGVVFFLNKGQVAQILVQEHKCVPVECYVENSPSKLA